MSRDFELLQRLEQEWSRSSNLRDLIGGVVPTAKQTKTFEIAQERTASVTQPSTRLAPIVRNEVNKIVLRTFLSTPGVKVVMFTGVEAQESAKWIAACTADVLADATRGRVCLLDADLASPTVHSAYSVSNQDGLAAVIGGSCSVSGATIRVADNLWLVPAGTRQGNSRLTAPMFQETIVNLLDQFEYLVISAPDCGQYTELGVIGAAVEGAVLVLDAVKTRRVAAKDAKAALEVAKIRILGSVFNNRSFPVPDLFYSHM